MSPRFRRSPAHGAVARATARRWVAACAGVVLLGTLAIHPTSAQNAGPAPAAVLPNTGLFAPVAAQLNGRLGMLDLLSHADVSPGRLMLLLETGQMNEAARLAPGLDAGEPAALIARIAVALAVQDFAAAAPFADRLAALPDADARALRYRWEFARDDAAALDTLTRARLAHEPDAIPELLAAGRLAYDMLDYPRADSLFTRALAALVAESRASSDRKSVV